MFNSSLLQLGLAKVFHLHQVRLLRIFKHQVMGDIALNIIILIILGVVSEESVVVSFVSFLYL
jgi:hypothetical protein